MTMNVKRGLIRFSIVLTVLWAVASFLIASDQLWDAMIIYPINDPDWNSIYSQLRQAYLLTAVVYWVAGVALWWAALYTGFWIAGRDNHRNGKLR